VSALPMRAPKRAISAFRSAASGLSKASITKSASTRSSSPRRLRRSAMMLAAYFSSKAPLPTRTSFLTIPGQRAASTKDSQAPHDHPTRITGKAAF